MLVLWPVHQLEEEHNQYPGIMFLSAVLKDHGFRSEVIAADEGLIRSRLHGEGLAVLAFSTMSGLAKISVDLSRRIKAQRPEVISVFGGAHPTYFPDMIEEDGVDGVCLGEGEYAMLDFVEALHEGRSPRDLQNWWIKEDGVIYRNPLRPLIENLDELPFPDREAFNLATSYQASHAIVMTGRGCPYGCTYCFNHVYQKLYVGKGNLVRRRSVDHVLIELHRLKDEGCRFIRFMDDLFTLQPEWVREFSPRYAAEIGLPFTCLVRANYVNEAVIADLKRAGCFRIMMGVETGNERLRREVLKRKMSDEQILEAARIIRASGIRLVTANILALPGGTLAEDWETVDLNIRARPHYSSASILNAFPGTEIHEISRSLGLIQEDHHAAVSEGGFGFTTALKIADPREKRQIENLHKFFPLLIWIPWLKPVVRQLIKMPPNRFFELMYMACINCGTHLISIPPAIGRPLLMKKFKRRFLPGRDQSPRRAEVGGA